MSAFDALLFDAEPPPPPPPAAPKPASAAKPKTKAAPRAGGVAKPDLDALRQSAQDKLMDAWAHIFEKYGKDTSDEADEVDVFSGEVVVDRGHFRNTPQRPFGRMLDGGSDDDGGGEDDEDEDDDDEAEAEADAEKEAAPAPAATTILSEIARKQRVMQAVPKLTLETLHAETRKCLKDSVIECSTPSSRQLSIKHSQSTPTHQIDQSSSSFRTPTTKPVSTAPSVSETTPLNACLSSVSTPSVTAVIQCSATSTGIFKNAKSKPSTSKTPVVEQKDSITRAAKATPQSRTIKSASGASAVPTAPNSENAKENTSDAMHTPPLQTPRTLMWMPIYNTPSGRSHSFSSPSPSESRLLSSVVKTAGTATKRLIASTATSAIRENCKTPTSRSIDRKTAAIAAAVGSASGRRICVSSPLVLRPVSIEDDPMGAP